MSDSIVTPGVRVGQVWQEVRARKNRAPRRIEVTGLGMGDVYCVAVNAEDERFGGSLSLPRITWDERYELVSEGGARHVPGPDLSARSGWVTTAPAVRHDQRSHEATEAGDRR